MFGAGGSLANEHTFAKLKPSKHSVLYYIAIRLYNSPNFFAKTFIIQFYCSFPESFNEKHDNSKTLSLTVENMDDLDERLKAIKNCLVSTH